MFEMIWAPVLQIIKVLPEQTPKAIMGDKKKKGFLKEG